MKKTLLLILVSALISTYVNAQAPTAVIKKATIAPVIDGTVDDVWAEADEIPIDVPYGTETPTTGNSWWKALWTDDGIYVLTFVDDDVFIPGYMGDVKDQQWNYDKVEIFFDCNYVKSDGGAPGTEPKAGHYQFAPNEIEALVNGGTATADANGSTWAFNATDAPTYYLEIFIPFIVLNDKDGVIVDMTEPIGFDVNINDGDVTAIARNRSVWANAGPIEDWSNMDNAGTITLVGAVGLIYVDIITITGGSITIDNGTLQMVAAIEPADATLKDLKWTVTNGTGKATISKTGLVTGVKDGTVTVKAAAIDGGYTESNEVTITISGQTVTLFEASYLQDGDFNLGDGTTPSKFWENPLTFTVIEGVATFNAHTLNEIPNPWDWFFGQKLNVPFADKDLDYIIRFKAWAASPTTFTVDIEDVKNGWPRFGISTDEFAAAGNSEWKWDLTTEPTVYTFHVNFANMLPDADVKLNFMAGQSTEVVYLDSIVFLKKTDEFVSAKDLNANTMKVYPNPVGSANELTVNLTSMNAKVAIYNSLGQKMMEKVANGNMAKFNVSSLHKGMYFIRLNDGTTQKFIK
jgi:hypothetical protein